MPKRGGREREGASPPNNGKTEVATQLKSEVKSAIGIAVVLFTSFTRSEEEEGDHYLYTAKEGGCDDGRTGEVQRGVIAVIKCCRWRV